MTSPDQDNKCAAPDARAAVERALNPRAIAILGASDELMKWGGSMLALLRKFKFGGTVYPINPRAESVQGLKAWPSVHGAVQAGGEPVDVALIAVPQQHTEAAFEDCAAAGVKVILMVTSQFAESGAEGAALQDRLMAIARRAGMRVIGPNCMGYFHSHADMNLLNSQALMRNDRLIKGEIALISQSGALAGAMLARAYDLGVGFSICVSLGNQADLEVCDFLDYAIDDARSKVIALYVEGVKNGRRFIDLLTRARAAGKPVLIVKAGRTELGQKAVQSHTASLAGEFRAFESQVRHAGAVLVDDFLELIAQAGAWTRLPAPSGPQVAVLSGSGGGGAVSSDLVGEAGLQAATLSADTVQKLLPLMPEAAAHLPFDLGAVPGLSRSMSQWLRQVLDTMLTDPGVGAGLFLMTTMPEMAATAATVVDVNRENPKPVAFVNAASSAGAEAGAKLKAEGLVNFANVKEALGYLRNRLAWEQHAAEVPGSNPVAQAAIAQVASGLQPGLVSEFDAKRLLVAAGIPTTRGELARDEDEAVRAADAVGYPVVMKLVSKQISHKSEVGGVVLNVLDADAVRQHFRALQQAVQKVPGASFDGCLVQQQARADVEVLIGTNWDAQFGAMLMIGIGGTLVELLKDTALLPASAGPRAIRRAIEGLRLYPLLDGYRGKPRANLDALVDVAQRFGQLATQLGARLPECEANPVMVTGDTLVVADARAVWQPSGG